MSRHFIVISVAELVNLVKSRLKFSLKALATSSGVSILSITVCSLLFEDSVCSSDQNFVRGQVKY